MCLSFNGGKDCTVLLHLLRVALPDSYMDVRCLYLKQDHEFPEIEMFITHTTERWCFLKHSIDILRT